MSMTMFSASRPSWASLTMASCSVFSSPRNLMASAWASWISLMAFARSSSSKVRRLRKASKDASSLLRDVTSSAAYSRFCVASAIALSHQPFWLASLLASCKSRSMSSWIKVLILANGSAAILLAKARSKVLLSLSPSFLSKFAIIALPSSLPAGPPRSRRTEARVATPWRKEGASCSSAAISMASMSSALVATASAWRTLAVCCESRRVDALDFSETAPLMMAMACVKVASSFDRTLVRWSQVFALFWHIFESSLVYSLSESNSDSTVDNCWIAD
mmetsp:Transcript_16982/g.42720  ORF Transcript_16982/g.42720 Transcript_16982/m.42720 type:complete len:276 (+) Transcript_16982:231-1058(+)